MQLTEWAEQTARGYLRVALPRRWSHVQEVAARAGRLAAALGADGELLRVAAWLHDVGYAPTLATTGFHPLDGARFLRGVGASERVCNLVAFHSSARAEAELFGVADQLGEFFDERTLTRDLLWFADMTIGPDGQCMTFPERMADVRARYDSDHYVVRALNAGMEERESAIRRAEDWISEAGLVGQV